MSDLTILKATTPSISQVRRPLTASNYQEGAQPLAGDTSVQDVQANGAIFRQAEIQSPQATSHVLNTGSVQRQSISPASAEPEGPVLSGSERMESILETAFPIENAEARGKFLDDISYFRSNPGEFASLSDDQKLQYAQMLIEGLHTIQDDPQLALAMAFGLIDAFHFQNEGSEFLELAAQHQMADGTTLLQNMADVLGELQHALGGSDPQTFMEIVNDIRRDAEGAEVAAVELPHVKGAGLVAIFEKALNAANRNGGSEALADDIEAAVSTATEQLEVGLPASASTPVMGSAMDAEKKTWLSPLQAFLIALAKSTEGDMNDSLSKVTDLDPTGEDANTKLTQFKAELDNRNALLNVITGLVKEIGKQTLDTSEDMSRSLG